MRGLNRGMLLKLITGNRLIANSNIYLTLEAIFLPMVQRKHVPKIAEFICSKMGVTYTLMRYKRFKNSVQYHNNICLFFKELHINEVKRFQTGYPLFNKNVDDQVLVVTSEREMDHRFLEEICSWKILEHVFGDKLLLKHFFKEES